MTRKTEILEKNSGWVFQYLPTRVSSKKSLLKKTVSLWFCLSWTFQRLLLKAWKNYHFIFCCFCQMIKVLIEIWIKKFQDFQEFLWKLTFLEIFPDFRNEYTQLMYILTPAVIWLNWFLFRHGTTWYAYHVWCFITWCRYFMLTG